MTEDYQSTIMSLTFGAERFIIPFMELDWRTRFSYLVLLCFASGLLGWAVLLALNKWGRCRI